MKAILLRAEGWKGIQIAQALRIHLETVRRHIDDYVESKKVKPEGGGSKGNLTEEQRASLIQHLEKNTYVKASEICAYVKAVYGVCYTESGMVKWLHNNEFSYKKPKEVPYKANPGHQRAFVEKYEALKLETPENEPILFGDAVHPTMATKVTCGWIRTGKDKLIGTTASRTRMNIMGSIELKTMEITVGAHETIDSEVMEDHFANLRLKYPEAPTIHLILDQGAYNVSGVTKAAAEKYRIRLYHLPPYSPNLNPIERLWKVMNERTRNNRFFREASVFRKAIMNFFQVDWLSIAHSMRARINDNFHIIDTALSS